MKKSEINKEVAEMLQLEEDVAENVINSFLELIVEKLKNGEEVKLHGFGTFGVRNYLERNCYNPQTGSIMKLKPSIQPYFKAGGKLRKELN